MVWTSCSVPSLARPVEYRRAKAGPVGLGSGRMEPGTAVIVGAGGGVGASMARAMGRAGHAVALLARDERRLTALGESLQAEGYTVGWTALDVADTAELTAAVTRFGGFSGRIDVLHFNAVAFRSTATTELTAADLLADLAVGTAALLTAVGAALPFMTSGGVVLATGGGAADGPMSGAASLGVQKAALRNLVTALDRDLRAQGIRAASLTVNGTIAAGTPFAPDRIADVLAGLVATAATPGADWRSVVPFDG